MSKDTTADILAEKAFSKIHPSGYIIAGNYEGYKKMFIEGYKEATLAEKERILKVIDTIGEFWRIPQEGANCGDFHYIKFKDHFLFKDLKEEINKSEVEG